MLEELQNELTYEQYNEMQVFDISQIIDEYTKDVENNMPSEYINKKYFGVDDIDMGVDTENVGIKANMSYTIPYNYTHIIVSNKVKVLNYLFSSSYTIIVDEHTEGVLNGRILIRCEIKGLNVNEINLSFKVINSNQITFKLLNFTDEKFIDQFMRAYFQWLYIIMNVFRKLSTINQQVYKSYIVHNNDKGKFKHLKSTKQNKYVRTNLNKDTHIILPTDFNITKFIHERDNSSIRKQYTYTHAFIVRGHFRTLNNPDTLGMNMLGERVIKGKTWVNSFMKNSKMQLVNKTKVVSYK